MLRSSGAALHDDSVSRQATMDDADRRAIESWSKKETEIRRAADYRETRFPSRTPLHNFFVSVSVAAGVGAFNMGVGQIVGIVFEMVGPIQYVLRIYVIALCYLVICNELEWTIFTRNSVILRNWITRGLFYAFIGVIGLEENDTSTYRDKDEVGLNFGLKYIKTVAWIMVACGALYFCLGCLCLHIIYNRLRDDYQQRLTRARNLRQSDYQQGINGSADAEMELLTKKRGPSIV